MRWCSDISCYHIFSRIWPAYIFYFKHYFNRLLPITLLCPTLLYTNHPSLSPVASHPPFFYLRLRRMSRKFSGQVIIMVPLIMLFFWRNLSFDNLSRNFLFIMNYYNLVQNIFGKKEGKKTFVSPCNFEIFPILPNLLRPTESFKGLRLNPYGFYLVILPLGIRWALMNYYIITLGMTKSQSFRQDLYGYDLFLCSRKLRECFSSIA